MHNVEARAILMTLLSDDRIEWVPFEPEAVEEAWLNLSSIAQAAPKAWMDGYLAAFATCSEMRLVTFDRGSEHFRANGLDLLLL